MFYGNHEEALPTLLGWGECCQANQILVKDTMVFEFVKQSAIQLHIFGAVKGKRCPVVLDAPNGEN
ncbi:hypothetical protein ACE6H2_002539 [Prunus campanulata]